MSSGKLAQGNGAAFEELIAWQNQRYKAQGIAIIEKQATEFIPIRQGGKIVTAKVDKKATVDYMGRMRKKPIAIEAKHTNNDRISLLAVEDHQAEFLEQWTKDGEGLGYVLVSFGMCEFYMIPWNVWSECRRRWKTKVATRAVPFKTPDFEFLYSGKGSLHKDELKSSWRVNCNGKNGLPFLEAIK